MKRTVPMALLAILAGLFLTYIVVERVKGHAPSDLDRNYREVQQENKILKGQIFLETKKRVAAELIANQAVARATAAEKQANARTKQRQDRLPSAPPPDTKVAEYWQAMYYDAEASVTELQAALEDQKKATAALGFTKQSLERENTALKVMNYKLAEQMADEHNARQCKILGLIKCPDRTTMFVVGTVTGGAIALTVR